MNVKDVIISMSRGWDKEKKLESPARFKTYDLLNTGRALYPLSYRETRGEQGQIRGSYLIRPLHTARISNVESECMK